MRLPDVQLEPEEEEEVGPTGIPIPSQENRGPNVTLLMLYSRRRAHEGPSRGESRVSAVRASPSVFRRSRSGYCDGGTRAPRPPRPAYIDHWEAVTTKKPAFAARARCRWAPVSRSRVGTRVRCAPEAPERSYSDSDLATRLLVTEHALVMATALDLTGDDADERVRDAARAHSR